MQLIAIVPRFVAAVCALTCLFVAGPAMGQGKFDRLYVFGDSLSDNGNVLSTTANSSFVTQRPTAPSYDDGRWTNGPACNNQPTLNLANTYHGGVWHEKLADRLGLPRATNSLGGGAGGTNYAYGGATTGTGGSSYTRNITDQVNAQYLANTPSFDSRHLYCIWGGGNDVRDAANSFFWNAQNVNAAASTAVTNIEACIESIIAAAPANTTVNVIWPNIPPMHRIPDFASAAQDKRNALSAASDTFSLDQLNAIDRITSGHANVLIHRVDILGYFNDVLGGNVPDLANLNTTTPILDFNGFSGLGFSPTRNAAVPNGADPDSYMFWDRVHPTARVHDLIGKVAELAIPAPGTVFIVVAGGWITAARRRRAA